MKNPNEIKAQHASVYEEVVVNNQYRVGESNIRGKNVIDIGANNGVFTLLARDYGAKRIISIESNVVAFALLKRNTEEFPEITVLNKAATAVSGKKMIVGMEPSFWNMDGRCYVVPDETGNVETVSINDVMQMFPEDEDVVLKIDCEGSEYEILYALKKEYYKRISTIFLEAHQNMGAAPKGNDHIEKLAKFVSSFGFDTIYHENHAGEDVLIFKFERDSKAKEGVTVLINGFNRPEYLKDQIESLNTQTVKPDKIIVLFTKPKKDFPIPYVDGVDFIVVENDQGLNTRFAVGLVAKTKFLCILDDDIVPGRRWIELCMDTLRTENAVICSYGVRYKELMSDIDGEKFGDQGIHSVQFESIDMAGHSWFMKKEWLKFFWMEEPLDWTVSDDIHLSYTMKKYGKLKLLVSPYPENDSDVWGNIKPELGLGLKALHARRDEDREVWTNPYNPNSWSTSDQVSYLSQNFHSFIDKRRAILEEYQSRCVKVTIVKEEPKKVLPDVTCVISTRNRYFSTLPLCLVAIANQTHKPKHLIIYDDGEHRDLRGDPLYSHIFSLLTFKGIFWEVAFGECKGQVLNHVKSLSSAKTDWIWRVDDDQYPESTVLEQLVGCIDQTVGAVGGLVIPANDIKELPITASNKIEDIYLGQNEQWYLHRDKSVKSVDHLYSTFIYRKDLAEYSDELSVVGHREETILTYGIKKRGYEVLVNPNAITWHFQSPQGGIRTEEINKHEKYLQDERVFTKKLLNWGIRPSDYSWIVMDNGIGDHYAFKNLLPKYLEQNKDKKIFLSVCYPEIFSDVSGVTLTSIADAKTALGDIDRFNIYKWMVDQNWKGDLSGAFRSLYRIPSISDTRIIKKGEGDTIIISPYSFRPDHPKSYPYWNDLVPLLKTLGYKLVQVGKFQEPPLNGMDDYWWGLPFKILEQRIQQCRCWLSGDNFLQHLVNSGDPIIKGIVIWGPSTPDHFGYPYNKNILKDRSLLRPDQFGTWNIERKIEAYGKAVEVFEIIKNTLH
jgi:FkbM family methyltransferase